MRKINIVFVVLMVVFLGLNIFQFLWWKNINTQTAEKYTTELANLQATLDSIGSRVEVYTVTTSKKAGDEIKAEDIQTMWTYSTLITDQFVTNPDDIIGRYFKIAVNPGTTLLKNMVMDEELIDSMRERDITLNRLTVGLEEGDYIDIRMTMPYGDDYVVLPHKRVYEIHDATIKLYMTELEWNIFQGALIDYYLNAEYGCVMYGDKYIEPGIQQEAVNFYAVPDNIAALLQKNPNIVDKVEAANLNEWRQSIDEILVLFRDEDDTIDSDAAKLLAGRETYNGNVTGDYEAIKAEREEEEAAAAEEAAENAANGTTTTDDGFVDPNAAGTDPNATGTDPNATGTEDFGTEEEIGDDFWDEP